VNERTTAESRPDVALVARARAGDEDALNQLVRRHNEVAYRVALGVVKDPDRAADAVQDAWIKAVRGLAGFRGDSRFRTWFLSIVVNEARGALRRAARRREQDLEELPEPVSAAPAPDRRVVVRSEVERALVLLDSLPEKQRLSVKLRLQEGLSFREVGEAIGSSEGAARVNYHHGIHRLREMMEE
jgi:RNA polymerase sigma-70 factor (ECF subfamily)